MIRILSFIIIVLIASMTTTKANNYERNSLSKMETPKDSLRLAELDRFWTELARTVSEGDFEGYKAAYHEDAVVVFASGKRKVSVPITKALASWKQGFNDTKTGKTQGSVEFRFSQRIGDETTAHETGVFMYKSNESNGKVIAKRFMHFEMLFVKHENYWKALMEYQKSDATEEEWESLQ
ncbi:MAG: ketosteroid isomerase-like protein [Saprospiraceae bacterium]|jgi:ketosteroid isomerase-like protein